MAKALSSVVMNHDIVVDTFMQIYPLSFCLGQLEVMLLQNRQITSLPYVKTIGENDLLNEKQLEFFEITVIQNLNILKGLRGRIPKELSVLIPIDIDSFSLYNIEHRSNLLSFNLFDSYMLYKMSKKLYEVETINRENNRFVNGELFCPFTELHKSFQKTHSISQKFSVVEEALHSARLQSELIFDIVCNYLEGFGVKNSKTAISNYLLCCTNDQDPKKIVDTILEYTEEPSCVNYQGLVTLLDQYFCRDSISIFRSSPSNIKFLITEYTGIEPYYICDTPIILGEESSLVEYLP